MSLSRSSILSALVIATSFPLGACMSSHPGAERPSGNAAPGGALITVENQHVMTMRVYLVRGATPIPLGSVDTMERRTFAVPTSMLGHGGTVRLMVDPLGSRARFSSGEISAGPGDRVSWTLAPSLSLSTYSVHRPGG